MKVIKKINNNVAVCLDNKHDELIAFGKGIGFPEIPYELTDLSLISRTFYGVDSGYFELVSEIPEDIFEISARIVEYARGKLSKKLNPNITFTLADHIYFSVQRFQKEIYVKMPISYDIQYLYEKETDVGEQAVKVINEQQNIQLGREEAASIAVHFINAEMMEENDTEELDDEQLIREITQIIERRFSIHIDQKNFNYSRFVSHMHYLLKRMNQETVISSENLKMFETVREEYSDAYQCAMEVGNYLQNTRNWELDKEELLYLMMHINRLHTREDCNQ